MGASRDPQPRSLGGPMWAGPLVGALDSFRLIIASHFLSNTYTFGQSICVGMRNGYSVSETTVQPSVEAK